MNEKHSAALNSETQEQYSVKLAQQYGIHKLIQTVISLR